MSTPNVLVVPALPENISRPIGRGLVGDDSALSKMYGTLRDEGIGVLTLPDIFPTAEYRLDFSPPERKLVGDYVARQDHLVKKADALVVVNATPEVVRDPKQEPICSVPYAVGRLASGMIGLANRVYGSDSRRVFLSHSYPDGSELFSTDSKRRSVNMARTRLLGLYPLHPVALGGHYDQLIETARKSHEQRRWTKQRWAQAKAQQGEQ